MALLCGLAVQAQPPSDPSTWGLRWRAPRPECIQPADLARAVEARLGRAVFGPDPDVTIDGELGRSEPQGWRAQLTLVQSDGTVLGSREVATTESDCRAIDARLELVIAVMIDPNLAFSGGGAARPTSEPSAPPVAVEPPAVTRPEAPPRPPPQRPPVRPQLPKILPPMPVTFTASAGANLGLTFSPAPQISASFWTQRPWLPWVVRLSSIPYSRFEKDGGSLSTVTGAVEVGACPAHLQTEGWRLAGCVTGMGALAVSLSSGFRQSRADAVTRADLGLRSRLERRLGSAVWLHLGVGASWGLHRGTVRLLKPNGTAEDLPLGSPVQGSAEVGLTLGP